MSNLGLSAAQIAGMSAEDLKTKLAQAQALSQQQAAFDAVKSELMTALIPAAETFSKVFLALSPAIRLIGSAIGLILTPLTAMAEILNGNIDKLSTTQKIVGWLAIGFTSLYTLGKLAAVVEASRNAGMLKRMAIAKAELGMSKAEYVLSVMRKAIAESRIISAIKYGAIQAAELARASALKVMDVLGLTRLITRLGLRKAEATVDAAITATTGTRAALQTGIAAGAAASLASTTANVPAQAALGAATTATAGAQAGLAAAALTTNAALTFGLGTVIAIAAAATAIGALIGYMVKAKKAGDIMSPAKGKTQVSTKEGGLFELSKNDDVAAGPGIIDKLQSSNTNAGSTVVQQVQPQLDLSMQPVVTAITSLQTALEGMLSNRTDIESSDNITARVQPTESVAIQTNTSPASTEQSPANATQTNTLIDVNAVVKAISDQNIILNAILDASRTPAPITIGSKTITELGSQLAVERSYNRSN